MPVTPILLAGLLAPVAYSFDSSTRLTYDVNVQLEGFLPLMGGNEGKVEINMAVGVTGDSPVDGSQKAASEIKAFDVSFNGAKLPLGISNVAEFFPKTTITLAPTGKILTTDAPDKKLPVRLPGLDVKHFPDVTYIPIELPAEEMVAGKEWTFTRDFGGAPIEYKCTADTKTGDVWKLKVSLTQNYKVLESPTFEVVAKPEDAESEVTTTMHGEGTVDFDSAKGRVAGAQMTNTAVSDVKNIKTGETKQRKLATKYMIKLQAGASGSLAANSNPNASWWDQTVAWSQKAFEAGKGALVWLQTATLFGLKGLPHEFDQFRPMIRRLAPWLGS